jgi:hypothetical protein
MQATPSDVERIETIMRRLNDAAASPSGVDLPSESDRSQNFTALDNLLDVAFAPSGFVANVRGDPHAVELAEQVITSFQRRLGRGPTPDELWASLRTISSSRLMAQQTGAGEVEIQEAPLPPLVKSDPFNAYKNHPIIGWTHNGRPIRSPFPAPGRDSDRGMVIRPTPFQPFPPLRDDDRQI